MWFDCPIEVIPAVDVLGTETVRLKQGDFETVVKRGGGPVDAARRLAAAGARRVHLVDLDGARSGIVRPALVREDGVYLVTGGYGAVGLELARYLTSIARPKLVLVGRTGIPARELWQKHISLHGSIQRTML